MGRIQNAWNALRGVEVRESAYDQTIIDLILQQATGDTSAPVRTIAPVEVAAGFWGRAFQSATVEPHSALTRAFTAPMRNMVGRAMVKSGELLMRLEVNEAGVVMIPGTSYDITGPENPNLWNYRASFQGPSGNTRRDLTRQEVAVFTYAEDPERPGHGISPLEYAKLTGQLARNVEDLLKTEHSSANSVGNVIPIPEDGTSDTLDALRATLKGLKGRTALVETTAGGWGDGVSASPVEDWKQRRMGPTPDKVTAELYELAFNHVLAACGVSPSLARHDSDGTSKREAWRQFLHGTIAPVALMVMEELSRLFEQEITLNFDRLFASDIMGRARAFGSLRTGGMAGDAAAEQTGFAWKEDENVVAMPTEDDEEDDEDEDGEDENGDGSDDGEEEDEAAA